MHLYTRLDEEAHYILVTRGKKSINLLLGEGKRVAHLHTSSSIVLEVGNLITLCLKLLGGIESHVSLALVEQLLNVFLVDVAALRLAIGAMVTTYAHTLVEGEAEPLDKADALAN